MHMNDQDLRRHLAGKEVTALWTTHDDTDIGRHRVEIARLPKPVFEWANKPGGNKKLLAALHRIGELKPAEEPNSKRARTKPEEAALVFRIPALESDQEEG